MVVLPPPSVSRDWEIPRGFNQIRRQWGPPSISCHGAGREGKFTVYSGGIIGSAQDPRAKARTKNRDLLFPFITRLMYRFRILHYRTYSLLKFFIYCIMLIEWLVITII
jgi:hypothetical protein